MPIYTRGAVQKSGASSPNETNELFRLSWNEASARWRNCASWPFSIRRRNQLLHFCNAPRIFAMRLPHLIDPRNPRDYRPNDVSLSNMAKVFELERASLGSFCACLHCRLQLWVSPDMLRRSPTLPAPAWSQPRSAELAMRRAAIARPTKAAMIIHSAASFAPRALVTRRSSSSS